MNSTALPAAVAYASTPSTRAAFASAAIMSPFQSVRILSSFPGWTLFSRSRKNDSRMIPRLSLMVVEAMLSPFRNVRMGDVM